MPNNLTYFYLNEENKGDNNVNCKFNLKTLNEEYNVWLIVHGDDSKPIERKSQF